MSAWSFEVKSGRLDALPIADILTEQQARGASWFLIAEAGVLLNEPEEKFVASIRNDAKPDEVLARVAHALSWLFDHLEAEVDQHFEWNYLKLTFINSRPLDSTDGPSAGRMTTNAPELPEPSEQDPALMMRQMVKSVGMFFSHLRGSLEVADWQTEVYSCDWVAMTFNKAG